MQPPGAFGSPGSTDRRDTEARVRVLFEAPGDDRVDRWLAAMSPAVTYDIAGASDLYPYFGRGDGIDAVAAMLRVIAADLETLASTVDDVLVEAGRVVLWRTAKLRHARTGRIMDGGIIDFVRLHDGMIVELSEYPDTAMLARLAGLKAGN